MKKIFTLGFLLVSLLSIGQVSITDINSTYTQDFNTLALTGTSSTTPTGWIFAETGTNQNTTYTASTGTGTGGDTYSYGAASNAERAFGGQRSGSLVPFIGAQFTNNTTFTINTFTINYTGEQWRLGTVGRIDRINFEYSLTATGLTSGSWIPNTSLDFVAPIQSGTTGALNGNIAPNRTIIPANTISGLSIPPGGSFWIRWFDFDASNADDGLSIDDFTMTYTGSVGDPNPPLINSLTPANNATNIATTTTNLVMNFNENIAIGTGNIVIKRFTDNSVFETINVSTVTVNNTIATIPFTNTLQIGTQYYVEVDAGAFTDIALNNFAGITGNATWNFTTDGTAPTITTLTPLNNATNVATTANLTALFNEPINKGTGNIVIKLFSDNSVVQTIDVSNAIVTITGGNTVNIDINDLSLGTQYYVEIDAGAFRDASNNNFAGITGNSTWNFTTVAAPTAGIVGNNYSFNSCASTFITEGWRQFSVTGTQAWVCTASGRTGADGIEMNAFVGSGNNPLNEDWLISPPFNLTSVTSPTLKFYSNGNFTPGNGLIVKVSNNYTPGQNPNLATWNDVVVFPAPTSNSNNTWLLTDNIDLSAYNTSNVFVAWYYNNPSTTTSSRWRIDDVTIYSNIVLPPCDEPTDQTTNLTLTPTATTVSGSFTAAIPAPSGYLVVRSSSSSLSATPTDGTAYTVGTPLGGGTVIANGNTTTFTDNGLTPTTPYYYFVFAYNNENCTGGANYNVTLVTPNGNTNNTTTLALAPCVEPSAPPTTLNLSATNTTISGSFTASASANRYLVVVSTSTPLGATPTDGTTYTAGSSLGSGIVVSYGASTTFNATGLIANTPYFIFVFAANGDCTGEPDYFTTSLDGTITTTNGTGVPAGYYDAAVGLTCQPLKTALKNIISTGTQVLSYTPGLWNLYPFSDRRRNDANTADIVWDTYSDNPTGAEPYTFTFVTNQCGSYTTEGQCYNREHSTPQSWFNELSPMVSDAHHIFPTDGKVNALHSSYPYGEVQTLTPVSGFSNPSLAGSKLGTSPTENFGYTGTVFEPIDEYKGDYARAFLYMAVRYEDEMISQNWSQFGRADSAILSTTDETDAATRRLQFYDDWYIKLLYKWHTQDPVSAKEIDRNNVIYSQLITDGATQKRQGNRNPFVDHPEYVAAIWGPSCLTVLPVTISNLSAKKVNNTAIISWKVSNEQNISKYEIERSTNGINFENIGNVNTANTSFYTFTDNNLPKTQRVYYRLKAIENSGKNNNTNIVSVDGNVLTASVKIYPNPTSQNITVQLNNAGISGNTIITITDITGRTVLQQNATITNQGTVAISVKHLTNGTYTLKVTSNNNIVNTKFVVSK